MKFPYFLELTKDEVQALTDLLAQVEGQGPLSELFSKLLDEFDLPEKYRVVGDEDIPIVLETLRKHRLDEARFGRALESFPEGE